MHSTRVGVDLAKEVIQVCTLKHEKVESNQEMSRSQFTHWLANSKPCTIVFEACGMSNYWMQKASSFGHDARLISARLVEAVRQNQKTDKNDALAIIQAAMLPDVQFISGKTAEQQQLQSIQRLRELAVKQRDALKKQIVSLLSELNIHIGKRKGGVLNAIDEVLEDADNALADELRQALSTAKGHLVIAIDAVRNYDLQLEKAIQSHEGCKKLLSLEGVGHINAVNLYIQLACAEAGTFRQGKDASACFRLTPIQHSTGGKARMGHISKVGNNLLRSQLITGAMSVVQRVIHRVPKTQKDVWLKQLIERRGKKCAAVALANKTVRTAFAMLRDGTEYTPKPIEA